VVPRTAIADSACTRVVGFVLRGSHRLAGKREGGYGAASSDLEDITHGCARCGTSVTRTMRSSPRPWQPSSASSLADNEFEGLVSKLLSIAIWHPRGEAPDYNLTPAEIRRALTVGPSSARRNVAWDLRRIMGDAEGEPADKATRWRNVVGPVFRGIWPLNAGLRSRMHAKPGANGTGMRGGHFPRRSKRAASFT
jgi:hypothetical protein